MKQVISLIFIVLFNWM